MPDFDISDELARQSILLLDCTIPPHLTLDDWRRGRRDVRLRRRPFGAVMAARAKRTTHSR